MFLEFLLPLALNSTAEALAGAGIERTPALVKRAGRLLSLVERPDLTPIQRAVRQAVDEVKREMLNEKTYLVIEPQNRATQGIHHGQEKLAIPYS